MFRLIVLTVYLTCVAAAPSPHDRIVGGINATIEDYPYQVFIRFFGRFICGGSILKANVVVTAAHCSGHNERHYSVVAGTSSLSNGGVRKKVSEIHIHPKYHFHPLVNDVAVFILSSSFDFTDSIQPIVLASSVPAPGSTVSVTGWGTTAELHISDVLQVVNVEIVSRVNCRKDLEHPIYSSELCAGVSCGGKGPFSGDSGGPLVFKGKLVGIVSWGDGSVQCNRPSVYANVPYLKSWIEKIIKNNLIN